MQDTDKTIISASGLFSRRNRRSGYEEDAGETIVSSSGQSYNQNYPDRPAFDAEKTMVSGAGHMADWNPSYRQGDDSEKTVASGAGRSSDWNSSYRQDDTAEKTVASGAGYSQNQNQQYAHEDKKADKMEAFPSFRLSNLFSRHKETPPGDPVPDKENTGLSEIPGEKPEDVKNTPAAPLKKPFFAWLLCIQGPDQWKDYRIDCDRVVIGRGKAFNIPLSDRTLSDSLPSAIITYENEKLSFLIKTDPENKEASILLNGVPVEQITLMQPYDRIKFGQTELLFVPVCCEKFDWDTEEKNTAAAAPKAADSNSDSPAQIIRCKYGHYYDSKLYSRCPVCNPGDKRPIDRLALAEEIWKANKAKAEAEKNPS